MPETPSELALSEEDFKDAAEALARWDLKGAVAALSGVVAGVVAGPIVGGVVTGTVSLVLAGLAKNATLRMLEEGERIDDERVRQAGLARLLLSGTRELLSERLQPVLSELERMDAERREDHVRSLRFVDRRLEELQEMLIREFRAASDPLRPESAELLSALRSQLVTTHQSLSGLFAEFLGELDAVFVELDLCEEDGPAHGLARGHGRARGRAPRDHELDRLAPRTLRGLIDLPPRDLSCAPRWVVLGDPGGGKTTLARHLIWDLAEHPGTRAEPAPLALYTSLPRLSEEHAHPFELAETDLCTARGKGQGRGLADALSELGKRPGRVWLLLDGLDEVAPGRRVAVHDLLVNLAETLPQVAIAVLTRPVGYEPLGGPYRGLARIQHLTSPQQRNLLVRWLGEAPGMRAHSAMSQGLRDACQLPLMLTLFAYLVYRSPDRPLPTSRQRLLEQSIDTLLAGKQRVQPGAYRPERQAPGVRDHGAARTILSELCLVLQDEPTEKWPRARLEDLLKQLRKVEGSRAERAWEPSVWSGASAFLDDVSERSGVLAAHDGPESPWGFLHRQFREVLAAKALSASGHASVLGRARALGARPEEIPRWAEVLGYVCESEPKPLELLQALSSANEELALRILPELETLDPLEALGTLRKDGAWDGDLLRTLIARWTERPGFDRDKVAEWLWRQVSKERSTLELAYVHYALEGLCGVVGSVDRERFFRKCERWPDGGPPRPKLVEIPAGSFLMGSPIDEPHRERDETPHRVKLSGFWLSPTAVTHAEYEAFDPAHANERETFNGRVPAGKAAEHPVVNVTWWEARLYCAWRGGRLPTEAQWEYACRAGTAGPFSFGENITPTLVNYKGNFPYRGDNKGKYRACTVPVGSLPRNPWGLYEMHGNVCEWCEDGYSDYSSEEQTDPVGSAQGQGRVFRGGSWNLQARYCRSAYRDGRSPGARWDSRGFRLLAVQPR